jgi:hypothetical protein
MLEPRILFLEAGYVREPYLGWHRLIHFLRELREPWRFFLASMRVQKWQRIECLLVLSLCFFLKAFLVLISLAVFTRVSREYKLSLSVLSVTRERMGVSFLSWFDRMLIMNVSINLHQITGRQIHRAWNFLNPFFLLSALCTPVVDTWLPSFKLSFTYLLDQWVVSKIVFSNMVIKPRVHRAIAINNPSSH